MIHSQASERQLGVAAPGSMRDEVIPAFAGCTAQPLSAPALAPMQPLDAPATLEGATSMTAPAPAPEEPLQAAAPAAAPVQVPATHTFLLRPKQDSPTASFQGWGSPCAAAELCGIPANSTIVTQTCTVLTWLQLIV